MADYYFNSYDDLLAHGQKMLKGHESGNLSDVDNLTGVEPSLSDEYLSQITEMNQYIYTVASTNEPSARPFFQPFFIDGVCRLSQAQTLEYHLTPHYIWVVYQNPTTGEYYDLSNDIETWEIGRMGTPLNSKDTTYLLTDILNGNSIAGEEVVEYVNNDLFDSTLESDPLVGIVIEDSCPCKKSLYKMINRVLSA